MSQTASASTQPAWLLKAAPAIFLLLWSAGFSIAKIGLQYAPPLTFLAMRFALSVAVLLALCVVRRPRLPRTANEWRHLIVVGLLVQVVYFGLSYLSMRTAISPSVVAVIVSLQPILVGVLAPRLVGEQVSVRKWIGLALGLTGAVGVIVARGQMHVESVQGVLFAAAALIGLTAAMLYEKRFGTAQDPLTANFVQYGVGVIFCAPIAVLFEHTGVQWSVPFVASLLYLVIGNSLIAISLLLAMTRAGQVSKVASLFFFVPPMAAVISWIMIGETLPPVAWGCMAVAIIGVAIATRSN